MIKALDTILRLGGIVYIFCIFIGLVITFIQIKFPAVEKMLRKIFQNKAGLILTVSVSLWAVLGVMYTATVAFHWSFQIESGFRFLRPLSCYVINFAIILYFYKRIWYIKI